MTDPVVHLGFDLGTTTTKLSIVDGHGVALHDLGMETRWTQLDHGWVERPAADLVAGVETLLAQAASRLEPGVTVASIGFASMAEAGVLVDADDQPCSPIIAWYDPRGAEEAAELDPDLANEFPAVTGLSVGPVATVFKLAWLGRNGVDLTDRQWLSLPEYVITRLGGRRVAEWSLLGCTGLLDLHTMRPWPPILDYLGVDANIVPEMVGAGTPVGRVRADHPVAAVRGAVLTVAGHDHAVAAAAAECGVAGSVLDSFGTAEAFVAAADRVPDPDTVRRLVLNGIAVYPHVVSGTTGLLAGTRGGLVLKRVLRSLGCSRDPARSELDHQAMAVGRDEAAGITIGGYALTDREVTISVMNDEPTPALLWRAAVDGSAVHGLELLTRIRSAGVAIDRVVVAGGWARLPSVMEARQSMAPTVERSTGPEPGSRGAARIGQWAAELAAAESESPTGSGLPGSETVRPSGIGSGVTGSGVTGSGVTGSRPAPDTEYDVAADRRPPAEYVSRTASGYPLRLE